MGVGVQELTAESIPIAHTFLKDAVVGTAGVALIGEAALIGGGLRAQRSP
jgi:hypothetical protein